MRLLAVSSTVQLRLGATLQLNWDPGRHVALQLQINNSETHSVFRCSRVSKDGHEMNWRGDELSLCRYPYAFIPSLDINITWIYGQFFRLIINNPQDQDHNINGIVYTVYISVSVTESFDTSNSSLIKVAVN